MPSAPGGMTSQATKEDPKFETLNPNSAISNTNQKEDLGTTLAHHRVDPHLQANDPNTSAGGRTERKFPS